MMLGRRRPSASLVAILTAGVLLALFIVHVLALGGIVASRGWFARTRQAQALISATRAALVDAEAGERGFLLTTHQDHLAAFHAAIATLPSTFAELRTLTSDDPVQRRNADDLEKLVNRKLDGLRATIDLHVSGQTERALALVRSGDGAVLMDLARRLVAEMREREDARLEERTIKARGQMNTALWIDGGALIGLLALGLVLFAIHRDIRRRQALEQALRDEAFFKEQFIAILSHDLQNPLSAVTMAAHRLRSAGVPDSFARSVDIVAAGAGRMTRMVEQLLDLARARQGGGIAVHPRPDIALGEVARKAIDELRAANPAAEVTLKADNRVFGSWDPDRLTQVASNLVANAIVHGAGRVDVRVRGSSDRAVLEVHNGGPPIPLDELPRIFEAFRSSMAKVTDQTNGLGLGLFISERIVAAHGGEIAVRSTAVEGTTFTVTIPITT
jgi:signal transduction histidine kinase